MRRVLTALVAVGALVAFAAAPAGAQEELGLETNILEGQPGEIVAGQVDTDDIAENCVTDLAAFQARFEPVLTLLLDPDGELVQTFFPDSGTNFIIENYDQMAYVSTALVMVGIFINQGGAAEAALPQTFVLTFADIATQEPVGEMGNFDPATGEGIVEVPDITPGQWAVAAACVGPSLDPDTIAAGFRESAEFLQEIGAPVAHPFVGDPEFEEFAQEFLDSDATGTALGTEFLEAIGPDLLQPVVVPDALGAVIFCILDENGECPTDVVPPGPDDDDEQPGPADAVVVQPDFTG
jgi:hypothetical protein